MKDLIVTITLAILALVGFISAILIANNKETINIKEIIEATKQQQTPIINRIYSDDIKDSTDVKSSVDNCCKDDEKTIIGK